MTRRRQFALLIAFVCVVEALPVRADSSVACAPDAASLYFPCSSCHGARADGNEAFAAPALAGLDASYVRRQLVLFQTGVRGSHPTDVYGQQMTLLARTLGSSSAVEAIACHVAALPTPPRPLPTLEGDVRRGARLYAASCAACHGPRAEGIRELGAPALQALADWYVLAQLDGFRLGWRGSDPADSLGQSMRAASMALTGPRDARDVAAFLARQR